MSHLALGVIRAKRRCPLQTKENQTSFHQTKENLGQFLREAMLATKVAVTGQPTTVAPSVSSFIGMV
jgi:hypothetical protein